MLFGEQNQSIHSLGCANSGETKAPIDVNSRSLSNLQITEDPELLQRMQSFFVDQSKPSISNFESSAVFSKVRFDQGPEVSSNCDSADATNHMNILR